MDIKATIKDYSLEELPIYNPDNFSFIFKKTEKVVCAVFYLTELKKDNVGTNDKTVLYIQDTARTLLDMTLTALMEMGGKDRAYVDTIRQFFRMESALQIALASGIIRAEHVDVLSREIEDIIRNIHRLTGKDERKSILNFDDSRTYSHAVRDQKLRMSADRIRERVPVPGVREVQKTGVQSGVAHGDRREAIRAVLKSKGQANIKDIADVVSDCSEKTIQRELISMITDGHVVREGDRRWSVYKLIS